MERQNHGEVTELMDKKKSTKSFTKPLTEFESSKYVKLDFKPYDDSEVQKKIKDKLKPTLMLRERLMKEKLTEGFIGTSWIDKVENAKSDKKILAAASTVRRIYTFPTSSDQKIFYFILAQAFCGDVVDAKDVEYCYTPNVYTDRDIGYEVGLKSLIDFEEALKIGLLYKHLNDILGQLSKLNINIEMIFCNSDLLFDPNYINNKPSYIAGYFMEAVDQFKRIITENSNITLVGMNFENPETTLLISELGLTIYGLDVNFVHDVYEQNEFTPAFQNDFCHTFKKDGTLRAKVKCDEFFRNSGVYTFYYKLTPTQAIKIDFTSTKENAKNVKEEIVKILSIPEIDKFESYFIPAFMEKVCKKSKLMLEQEVVDEVIKIRRELG